MVSVQYTIFLVTGMLITGACNTLLNKFQDKQCVKDCDTDHPKHFEQPVLQTLNMFMGEALCLIANYIIQYYSKKKYIRVGSDAGINPENVENGESELIQPTDSSTITHNNVNIYSNDPENNTLVTESVNKAILSGKATLLLWLPSILDICGTTLMNVGLIYVAASVYQMLRGAVVIFTGFFSVVFLKRKLSKSQWIALFLVMIGVSIVGMSNIITKSLPTSPIGEKEEEDNLGILNNHVSSKNILGVGMVILAQIFTALQFIIEEKVMSRYEVGPLKTVGLEGTFGLFTVLGAIPFLYFFIGRYHQGGFFDIPDGASQIFSNMTILLISIGCICSIAFFNWFGLSVTNAVSATSRSTIDTCRTVLIWMISLYLGWETFNWFQVLGFIVLIYGTFIFNGIANLPFSINKTEIEHRIPNERRPLLDDSSSPISPDDENHFTNL
ncbi:hypothetical protein H8356DRAFT_1734936 [Neocallimastix lanati (nom. inval.)]|jgi:drug/metabolite transporter (DMT)-like permease|uniref:Integral membrane protein n=1 Tax=Neocallimastix californiae TaxID=1754190 RepID=A0A1Y2A998_9FUNG|nr:hypothetical protein H8356DRAFT_1734936 [Neocallimastix sp. JGI-2020a]ORY19099.1 hypothetical protein LY90DRAFT_708179 [Neocallimastix californiae]|eukprot:ORY19099.1 hypothetical protein LY90DRAFT_708179 [Neocallimastix californiae]